MTTNAVAPLSNLAAFIGKLIDHEDDLRSIVKETIDNGGSSTDLSRLGDIGEAPSHGYMVGGVVKPRVLSFEDFEKYPSMTVNSMSAFIAEHAARLSNPWGRAVHLFGTWVDESTMDVHLDVVEHVTCRARALALAEERGELAIWDIALQTSILTKHGEAASV